MKRGGSAMAMAVAVVAVVAAAGCTVSGEAVPEQVVGGAVVPPLSAATPATPTDPGPFLRTGNLYLLRAGEVAACGIGLDLATGQMGNLTCHLPPNAIPGVDPSTIDIDTSGVHAAGWPRWSGAITELLPGQSLTVGSATCTASAGPRLRCQNGGGWVDTSATGTTVSMPPAPLSAAHGG